MAQVSPGSITQMLSGDLVNEIFSNGGDSSVNGELVGSNIVVAHPAGENFESNATSILSANPQSFCGKRRL